MKYQEIKGHGFQRGLVTAVFWVPTFFVSQVGQGALRIRQFFEQVTGVLWTQTAVTSDQER